MLSNCIKNLLNLKAFIVKNIKKTVDKYRFILYNDKQEKLDF